MDAQDDTKQCPYCAETIKAAAIKCRYCQSDLTGSEPATAPAPAPPPAPAPEPTTATSTTTPTGPATIAPTTPPARSGRSRRPSRPSRERAPRRPVGTVGWAVFAVAMLVTVALLVLTLLDWREATKLDDARQARTTAQAAVAEKVEALLSYEYETFDEDLEAARKVMTPSFREEYEPTVESIRERAVSQKQSQDATVVAAAALPSEDPDRVELLLFVDTVSVREGSTQQRVLQNRVKVTLVREDGTWLVDDLSVPQS